MYRILRIQMKKDNCKLTMLGNPINGMKKMHHMIRYRKIV